MNALKYLWLSFNFFFLIMYAEQNELPVVLWHGMGDSCCYSWSMGVVIKTIMKVKPNIYVKSLKIGSNLFMDSWNSFFMDPNKQVDYACKEIQKDNKLKNGYNAIGFSQGALFMRALAEKCSKPQMVKFISIGGPQQGVFGAPTCDKLELTYCKMWRSIVAKVASKNIVQKTIIQSQYFHNPFEWKSYPKSKLFLADINNESGKNVQYKKNISRLQKLVLVMFEKDEMVLPPSSSWFGFYAPGQAKKILKLEDTDLYKKDLIGLKTLNESNRLKRISIKKRHLEYDMKWLTENIIRPYL